MKTGESPSRPLHRDRVDFLRADVASQQRGVIRSHVQLGVALVRIIDGPKALEARHLLHSPVSQPHAEDLWIVAPRLIEKVLAIGRHDPTPERAGIRNQRLPYPGARPQRYNVMANGGLSFP